MGVDSVVPTFLFVCTWLCFSFLRSERLFWRRIILFSRQRRWNANFKNVEMIFFPTRVTAISGKKKEDMDCIRAASSWSMLIGERSRPLHYPQRSIAFVQQQYEWHPRGREAPESRTSKTPWFARRALVTTPSRNYGSVDNSYLLFYEPTATSDRSPTTVDVHSSIVLAPRLHFS